MKLFIYIYQLITLIALRNKKMPALTVVFILSVLVTLGQQYPVKVVPQLLPPFTLILSDYYSGTIPKLSITLINTDLQQPLVNVRLRMTIKNGGSIIARSKDNQSYPIITLLAGVPQRVSLNDLAPYFNPANLTSSGAIQGVLPEGSYEFAFEVLESNTGAVISNTGSAYAFITLNDPPFLNLPLPKVDLINNQPIVFTWTPRNQSDPNSAFTTEYELQIAEEWGGYLGAAFDNRQPLFTTTTNAPVFVYGPASPQLIPGKYYIWRVRARNKNGIDYQNTFKNNGYSEIRWFKYQQAACPPVQGLQSFVQNIGGGGVRISWIAGNTEQTKLRYRFMYGEYRNAKYVYNLFWTPWFDAPDLANISSYNISNKTKWLKPGGHLYDPSDYAYIHPGTIIEYEVTDVCSVADNSSSVASGKIEYQPYLPRFAFDVSGSLFMAYRNTESASLLVNPSLLKTDVTPDAFANIPISTEASGGKFPLKGVNVILTYTNGGNVIAVATTNPNGVFQLPFSAGENENVRTKAVTLTYHDPSGVFNDKSFSFPNGLDSYQSEWYKALCRELSYSSAAYTLPENILLVPSFRFKPSVTLSTVASGNISLDVLIPDDNNTADAIKVMQSLSLASNPEVVTYNGKRHKIITTFTDGRQFKRLISNTEDFPNYIIRVN